MKLPKVGDKFYWKDSRGNVRCNTCAEVRTHKYEDGKTYERYFLVEDDTLLVEEFNVISYEVGEKIYNENNVVLDPYWTDDRINKIKNLFTEYNDVTTNADMFWDELKEMINKGEF